MIVGDVCGFVVSRGAHENYRKRTNIYWLHIAAGTDPTNPKQPSSSTDFLKPRGDTTKRLQQRGRVGRHAHRRGMRSQRNQNPSEPRTTHTQGRLIAVSVTYL